MSNGKQGYEIANIEDDELRLVGLNQAPTMSLAIQAVAALADKRITTAKQWPRSIANFMAEAKQLLSTDIKTAESAEYSKPVGGGTVKGASVRLAELAAMCWGNLEVEMSAPEIGDKFVTVKASAWDLQRNYRQEAIATTSILTKTGTRYGNAMIETACAATAAKARRNAILQIIPRSYIGDLLDTAKAVASKNVQPIGTRRASLLDFFARSYKVKPEQIFQHLGITGIEDIDEEKLSEMRDIATSLKDGESKVEEWFATPTETKTDAIKKKLEERKTKAKPEPKSDPAPLDPSEVKQRQPGEDDE